MTRFLLSLLACLATAPAIAGCPWRVEFVAPSSKPQSPEAFEGVGRAMSMPSIVGKLGPAARDVGSGAYVLEWDVTDGRVFYVSTADACGHPVAAGFRGPEAKRPPVRVALLSGDPVAIPPDFCLGQDRNTTCAAEVSFDILADGSTSNINITRSSRIWACDRAVVSAVRSRVYEPSEGIKVGNELVQSETCGSLRVR